MEPTRHVLWRGLGVHSARLEHLCLTPWTRAEGAITDGSSSHGDLLRYRVEIGIQGSPTRTTLQVPGHSLTLRRSPAGEWSDGQGRRRPELSGCTDVDIQATPFTNTLPIRRLSLDVGRAAEVLAAWVSVPDLQVRPCCQRYTRLGELVYRYENLDSGYVTEVIVDAHGLVWTYPGAFQRLMPRP